MLLTRSIGILILISIFSCEKNEIENMDQSYPVKYDTVTHECIKCNETHVARKMNDQFAPIKIIHDSTWSYCGDDTLGVEVDSTYEMETRFVKGIGYADVDESIECWRYSYNEIVKQ